MDNRMACGPNLYERDLMIPFGFAGNRTTQTTSSRVTTLKNGAHNLPPLNNAATPRSTDQRISSSKFNALRPPLYMKLPDNRPESTETSHIKSEDATIQISEL